MRFPEAEDEETPLETEAQCVSDSKGCTAVQPVPAKTAGNLLEMTGGILIEAETESFVV